MTELHRFIIASLLQLITLINPAVSASGASAGVSEVGNAGPAQRLVAERRWRLAMQSQAHPSSIMREVVACLQQNQVSWKKQAPYNLKCRKAIGLAGTHMLAPFCPARCKMTGLQHCCC